MTSPGRRTSPAEARASEHAERETADRQRALPGMLAAALGAYGTVNDTMEGGISGLQNHAANWLDDPTDPRGAALREYVGHLALLIAGVDSSRQDEA